MGSGDPTHRFSANSNASLILLYNCPTFRDFTTKIIDALEFAKIHIFGIGIHHTSLLGTEDIEYYDYRPVTLLFACFISFQRYALS